MIGQLHKMTQKYWVWKFNCEQKRGSRLARAASKVGQNHWAIASSTTDTRTAKINLGMVETACALNLAAIQ
jgi:ribulose-5-phosphate 4-epimerase/fuculose-1-phosphate aldolase